MPPFSRYAILLDGGFVIKKLERSLRRFPSGDDIQTLCSEISQHELLRGLELLRIYFYHAPPAKDNLTNPISKERINLSATPIFSKHASLLDKLELTPNFALRLGETVTQEWRLGSGAMKSLLSEQRPVEARDLVPNVTQKGVDLRIGLDIARLALREMVSAIVVVTGDSDLIPAFKFARREGLRVYLHALDHGIRRDLKAHADIVF
jgi:uncharacterized LabA/DUF88 family protein